MSIDWSMPWLLLLAAQPLVILLLRKYFEQRHLDDYVTKDLQPWVVVHERNNIKNKLLLRNIAYCLAWLLFAIAAAGPRLAEETPNNINSAGKDIMIVLDISQSMHAADLSPNRLRQAHRKIDYLINNTIGSRIGIIVYAAKPHLYVPLTYDKEVLHFYLKNIKFLIPPSQGSRPLSALKLAHQYLTDKELPNKTRASSIVLLTDADTTDNENNKLKDAAAYFTKNKTPVFTLLLASNNGEAIPDFDDGWLHADGRPIISRPASKSYQHLSESSSGHFQKASSNNDGIKTITSEIRSIASTPDLDSTTTNWNELFYIFLFPAIVLIFITMFPYKLRNTTATAKTSHVNAPLIVIFIVLTSSINEPIHAGEQDELRSAYQALIKEEYIKSRELYSSINTFEGRFGEAISSYRLSDYPRAIRLFEQAVLLTNSNQDITRSLYNLGNSYFQVGNYALAISSYEGALLYQPQHQPSIKNKAYTEKALRLVEERKKILAITSRAGKGPKKARAADNIFITENNNVSLDDSESENNNTDRSNVDAEMVIPEFIILRGLEFANDSSATRKQTRISSIDKNGNAINLSQLDKLLDNQSLLWRRIFELEEGYPAPQDEPDVLTGVRPW